MNYKIVTIVGIFFGLVLNSFNDSYQGDDAEYSFETNFMKHRLIKEDYIRYYSYYKPWKENFSHIDTSKIDIKKLPFPYSKLTTILPFDGKGWYCNSEYIRKLFQHNHISNAIEIGSYLGVSTRHIGSLLPEDGKLYAIDTWNVFNNHYEQFLSNIIISGLTNKIVPVQNRSDEAIKTFLNGQEKFDLIYVDAGHEVLEVLSDLENYYPVLSSTGVICGDDWLWKTVRHAVLLFAQKYNLTVYADCSFWFLKKEDCGYCYKSFLTANESAWKFGIK